MRIQSEIFGETFSGPQSIAYNSGSITGSPVFQDGIILDGSSDYVSYQIPNTLLAKDELTFCMEFYPSFDYDDDSYRFLFETEVGQVYRVYKGDNGSGNILSVRAGNSTIEDISSAVWSPHWRVGERNVLVVSLVSGASNAWLNGSQILTDDTKTYSNGYPSVVYVGSSNSGDNLFAGRIKSFQIYNRLFTSDDAINHYNNSLYSVEQKAEIYLDMKTAIIDGSSNRTKDKSVNGHLVLLGDGSTSSTAPEFKNPGFELDGSSDFLSMSGSGIYNHSSQSIVVVFSPSFDLGDSTNHYIFDSTNGSRHSLYKSSSNTLDLLLNGTQIFSLAESTFSPYWKRNSNNVIVIASESGDTDVWLNGYKIVDADNTSWSAGDTTTIYLGSRFSVSNFWAGRINHFSTYNMKLSDIQADYLYRTLRRN